ncbi:MAG: aminotransferase class I/II-fold pyridoxal phosphate-dependent enzyme [Gemmatimonadetes bacterium]|nr:aminotransferase class I/II-fold pyridoxal phosphate-dependent enzyme [Gemmatimonadota bacterium]
MSFVPFELERWQSVWEHRVRFNLSESGVHPLSLHELLEITDTDLPALETLRLGYGQSNGSDELRAAIAATYPGATADNVLVTTGGSEANFITCWSLLRAGDLATLQVPNYLQTWGVARSMGVDVNTFSLRPDDDWNPDLDEIQTAIRPDTRLVVVTNPNNPTGRVLTNEARGAIIKRVREVGAWLLVDEVYQGAELDDTRTETCFGRYDRVIVTNGLSKAYALPGLRIGWIVGPADLIRAAWERHDYTVICPSAISDFLAVRSLAVRERILERTRTILRHNYGILEEWLQAWGELFTWRRPDAGAICLAEYALAMDSVDLVQHLRAAHDVLVVPGAHVGLTNSLRIGFGDETTHFQGALKALRAGLEGLISD